MAGLSSRRARGGRQEDLSPWRGDGSRVWYGEGEASWVREEEAGAGCRILDFQGSSIKSLCLESPLACVGSHLPSVTGELWEGLLSWAPPSPSPTERWFHCLARNLELGADGKRGLSGP